MEDVYSRLHLLEAKMLQHYEEIDKIAAEKTDKSLPSFSPEKPRAPQHSFSHSSETSDQSQRLADIEQKLASFASLQTENQSLRSQVALLTEKIALSEAKLSAKTNAECATDGQKQFECDLSKLKFTVETIQKEMSEMKKGLDAIVGKDVDCMSNAQVEPLKCVARWLQSELTLLSISNREKEAQIAQLTSENSLLKSEVSRLSTALQRCQESLQAASSDSSLSEDIEEIVARGGKLPPVHLAAMMLADTQRLGAFRELSQKVADANSLLQSAFLAFSKVAEGATSSAESPTIGIL